MEKSVVLGASGFVGKNLTLALNRAGVSVVAYGLGNRPEEFPDSINWCAGDFVEGAHLKSILENADSVYHLVSATVPASAQLDRISDIERNLIPSVRLMDECVAAGVKQLIFVSSGGTVYGPHVELPTPETAPTNPISAYGATKLAIEKYLGMYWSVYGLSSVILRLANPFGPYQSAKNNQGAIGIFMERILAGIPIDIWGKGDTVRDYVYIADVCDALLKARQVGVGHRVYNIGIGKGHDLIDLIKEIELVVGKKAAINFLPGRSVDVSSSILDVRKAESDLDWVARTTLSRGLVELFSWISRHPS